MLTSSSAWRSFFSCSSCSSTPPKRYLPDDGPELVWTNPADNVLKKGRAAGSSSYKTLPTSSSPPPNTTTTSYTTSTTTPFTFHEVPLQRTMQSMDTHTTVTMNAISFDSQDWEDDDDDDMYDIYDEDDVVTHRVPELSLSKPMIPIDDDSSRCMMIGPIGCSYPYASTALIQGYDDDDDDEDDDEEEPIVVAQHISQLASRIGQSMERTFSQDGGQRRMLPRAWSW